MKFLVVVSLFLLVAPSAHAQASLTITSEPNAIVWIDEIRRGTTDASGKLTLTKVSAGRHSVRVRASGFKETTAALLPGRRALAVKLLATTDPAELKFQEAETAREKARLENAADLYREACEDKHAEACFRLAGLYQNGAGVFRDTNRSKSLYKRACDFGYLEACKKNKPT